MANISKIRYISKKRGKFNQWQSYKKSFSNYKHSITDIENVTVYNVKSHLAKKKNNKLFSCNKSFRKILTHRTTYLLRKHKICISIILHS